MLRINVLVAAASPDIKAEVISEAVGSRPDMQLVKHGVVAKVGDWPYSSFHAYVRRGVLPADWAEDVRDASIDFGERRG